MQEENKLFKKKWYLSTWIIALCFTFWFAYGVPLLLGIILLYLQNKETKNLIKHHNENINVLDEIEVTRYFELTEKLEKIKSDFELEKQGLVSEIDQLRLNRDAEKDKVLKEVEDSRTALLNEIEKLKQEKTSEENSIEHKRVIINELNESIQRLESDKNKKDAQLTTQINKIKRLKEIYKSVEYSIKTFFEYEPAYEKIILPDSIIEEINITIPSVILKLHHMDVKDLRKAFKENDKSIEKILEQYQDRYTTKTNKAIYRLMVIALKAELQNILYSLKYDKLDAAIDNIKQVTKKYLNIASEGNQNIAGTLAKFIGELEYLFINAAKIEYNYYVKKEQIKQEQLNIRQQMKEEAEERRLLKIEKEKIE